MINGTCIIFQIFCCCYKKIAPPPAHFGLRYLKRDHYTGDLYVFHSLYNQNLQIQKIDFKFQNSKFLNNLKILNIKYEQNLQKL